MWQLVKLTSLWVCGEWDVFGKGWVQLTTSNVPKLGKKENQEAKLPFSEKKLEILEKKQPPKSTSFEMAHGNTFYFVFTTLKV